MDHTDIIICIFFAVGVTVGLSLGETFRWLRSRESATSRQHTNQLSARWERLIRRIEQLPATWKELDEEEDFDGEE